MIWRDIRAILRGWGVLPPASKAHSTTHPPAHLDHLHCRLGFANNFRADVRNFLLLPFYHSLVLIPYLLLLFPFLILFFFLSSFFSWNSYSLNALSLSPLPIPFSSCSSYFVFPRAHYLESKASKAPRYLDRELMIRDGPCHRRTNTLAIGFHFQAFNSVAACVGLLFQAAFCAL